MYFSCLWVTQHSDFTLWSLHDYKHDLFSNIISSMVSSNTKQDFTHYFKSHWLKDVHVDE